ncbi:MAG: hypothetical protein EXS08_10200 [Planctomycetes bacterium]|nr:hypothetical protein [Planctomycetota bacterium]
MPKPVAEDIRPGLTRLQLALLALLVLALLASVGYRAYTRTHADGRATKPAGATGLVTDPARGGETPAATQLERSLPYVTEGSFFGLIGFALGYASRKFVKLGLILVALFFVGLQALAWTGTVSVDWSGMLGKLNALLFNLQENESMTQFLTRRIPSAGGMAVGYLIGFQRG